MNNIAHDNLTSAIFAGGCFWCVEADFKKRPDIKDIESGYTGGETDGPSYETAAENGHREAVRVWYDPEETDYQDLVAYFFATHDPTDPGGSFADRGVIRIRRQSTIRMIIRKKLPTKRKRL